MKEVKNKFVMNNVFMNKFLSKNFMKVCGKIILSLCPIFLLSISNAQGSENLVEVEASSSSLVEIETAEKAYLPYLERRKETGWTVDFSYIPLALSDYSSALDGVAIKTAYGDSVVSYGEVSLGWKVNWKPLSAEIIYNFGTGSLSSSGTASDRTLKLLKHGLGARINLDGIHDNPWFVPYAAAYIQRFNISESDATSTESIADDAQLSFKYSLGLKVPLSNLDPDSAQRAFMDINLQNTYLDLFVTKYTKTQSSDDPNIETGFLFGGGLSLEF